MNEKKGYARKLTVTQLPHIGGSNADTPSTYDTHAMGLTCEDGLRGRGTRRASMRELKVPLRTVIENGRKGPRE